MGLLKKMLGIIGDRFHIDFVNDGPMLKNNAGVLEIRDADDVALAIVRGATPVGDTDLVNKLYADSLSKPVIVSRQADTSASIPTNTAARGFLVVSTAGSGAVIGDLLFDDGSSSGPMAILAAIEGRCIAVTDALTGGTVTFEADSIYIWDDDGTTWVKVGDVGNVTGAMRVIRYILDNTASQDSATSIDANNVIHSAQLKLTTPYSGGATINVGTTADADLILDELDNNPQKPADTIFLVEQDTVWPINSVVRTTVGGAPAAGDGVMTVIYSNPNG